MENIGELLAGGFAGCIHGLESVISAETRITIPQPSKLTVMRSWPMISVISIIRLQTSSIRWLHWFRSRGVRFGLMSVELKILNVGFIFDSSVRVGGMAYACVMQDFDQGR
jgi:hypothetical protein